MLGVRSQYKVTNAESEIQVLCQCKRQGFVALTLSVRGRKCHTIEKKRCRLFFRALLFKRALTSARLYYVYTLSGIQYT